MKLFNWRSNRALALVVSIAGVGCIEEAPVRPAALPYYSDASFTPHWLAPDSEALANFHEIPDFELTNQNGEKVTRDKFDGRIYVVDFFFTSCGGICPKMTANMALVQEAFRGDEGVRLLSHSVTPTHDTVEVLAAYAKKYGIDDAQWDLVTGPRAEIYDLGRTAYFVEEDLGQAKDDDDFLHTENFVLVDAKRHVRGVYNGLNKASVAQLIRDIQQLRDEAP